MKRSLAMVYALVGHLIFGIVFVYHLAFLLDIIVPKTINSDASLVTGNALLINIGLIALFGLQHSLMARPTIKKWIPKAYERSTFALASSIMLMLIMVFWQAMPQVIWSASSPILRALLHGGFFAGVVLVLLSIIQMDYLEFFGLKQAYQSLQRRPITTITFRLPLLYRLMRHPLMLGLLMMYWFTPYMAVGHMVLASGMTVYIFIGLYFEERDLVNNFGEDYLNYRQETPMLIPNLSKLSKQTPK